MHLAVPEAQSKIPADTVRAYHATEYQVLGLSAAFTLRIDAPSRDLADCHRAYNVDCSAFITAWNPYGERRPEPDNDAAQARLVARLRLRGYRVIEGRGEDPQRRWPAEASLLVLGMPLEDACGLGREFEQNAVLWAGGDACPRLVLLI